MSVARARRRPRASGRESRGARLAAGTSAKGAGPDRPLLAIPDLWRGSHPPILPARAPLADAVRRLLTAPGERLLLIVDAKGALAGTLTWGDLYEDLFLTLTPPEISPAPGAHCPQHPIRAEDLMSDPVSVTPKKTLREALRILYRNKLKGLPVVDSRNRPIGYLRLDTLVTRLLA